MNSSSSSRLNLSSPIYQSPIRTSKRSDFLRLPSGLNTSSFKGEVVLSQRGFNNYNIEDENNFGNHRKLCCPNCRYVFNLAIDQKILQVLTKDKATQTNFQQKISAIQQKIDQQAQRTAKQLGIKVKSVLLMQKLYDMSKSKTPRLQQSHMKPIQQQVRVVRPRNIAYQDFKHKQIDTLLRYTKDYLKEDTPSFIKLMFQDYLLWPSRERTITSAIPSI